MKTFSKKHQITLNKFKNFFGYSWRHTLTLLLALIVTVSFTHSALAGVQTAQAVNGEVTVKTPATITPTPTAFASAVNATTTTVPPVKATSADQTALTIKSLTRTVDSAALDAATQPATTTRRLAKNARLVTSTTRATSSHRFAYGYCTDWVAQKAAEAGQTIPWGGNASSWDNNAAALGYKVGKQYAGANTIMVTSEGGRTGHVVWVEKVENGKAYVTEKNFKGWNRVSEREIDLNNPRIVAFIDLK